MTYPNQSETSRALGSLFARLLRALWGDVSVILALSIRLASIKHFLNLQGNVNQVQTQ